MFITPPKAEGQTLPYKFYTRVSNIDIALKQDAQPFLPVYGGTGLKRMWHIGTGDVSVNFNMPLSQDRMGDIFRLASQVLEFDIEITYYYDRVGRRVTGCIVDSMSVNCEAGSIVNVSVSAVGKLVEPFTSDENLAPRSYTKGVKLVTWDKCVITFPRPGNEDGNLYLDEKIQSFSYNITNGLKSIKTAEGLFPRFITNGIQDVSGQIQFYDIVYPHRGDKVGANLPPYQLGFNSMSVKIDDLSVEHGVVFNPTQSIPLTSGVVVSAVTWTRSDIWVEKQQ